MTSPAASQCVTTASARASTAAGDVASATAVSWPRVAAVPGTELCKRALYTTIVGDAAQHCAVGCSRRLTSRGYITLDHVQRVAHWHATASPSPKPSSLLQAHVVRDAQQRSMPGLLSTTATRALCEHTVNSLRRTRDARSESGDDYDDDDDEDDNIAQREVAYVEEDKDDDEDELVEPSFAPPPYNSHTLHRAAERDARAAAAVTAVAQPPCYAYAVASLLAPATTIQCSTGHAHDTATWSSVHRADVRMTAPETTWTSPLHQQTQQSQQSQQHTRLSAYDHDQNTMSSKHNKVSTHATTTSQVQQQWPQCDYIPASTAAAAAVRPTSGAAPAASANTARTQHNKDNAMHAYTTVKAQAAVAAAAQAARPATTGAQPLPTSSHAKASSSPARAQAHDTSPAKAKQTTIATTATRTTKTTTYSATTPCQVDTHTATALPPTQQQLLLYCRACSTLVSNDVAQWQLHASTAMHKRASVAYAQQNNNNGSKSKSKSKSRSKSTSNDRDNNDSSHSSQSTSTSVSAPTSTNKYKLQRRNGLVNELPGYVSVRMLTANKNNVAWVRMTSWQSNGLISEHACLAKMICATCKQQLSVDDYNTHRSSGSHKNCGSKAH